MNLDCGKLSAALALLAILLAIVFGIQTYQAQRELSQAIRNVISQNDAQFRAFKYIQSGGDADVFRNLDGTSNVNFKTQPVTESINVETHLEVTIERVNGTVIVL